MKTLIILVCVVVANVQGIEVLRELLGKAVEDCKAKTQATTEDIQQLLQHKPLTSTPGKCLAACINKKFKIQTADGAIDAQATREAIKLTKHLSEDIYQKVSVIVDTCLGQVHEGDNECDIAYSFFTCTMNEAAAAKLPAILADIL